MLDHRPLVALGAPTSTNPDVSQRCNLAQLGLTDAGNAQRFADLFADTVRYVPTRGWFLFSQTHWEPISYDTMLFLARESLDEFLEYTTRLTDEDTELCDHILKHLARSESLPRLQAMIRLVRAIPVIRLSPTKLDANPYLLNLSNGTLNLRSGELLPHSPQHYLTHLLPYDYAPEATSPAWTDFLDRLTGFDPALHLYLQRAVGSTLFGNSSESTCFLLIGPNPRAHQLFLSTLRSLLGSYSTHTLSLQKRDLSPDLFSTRLLTLPSSALARSCDPSILSAFLTHDPLTLPDLSSELTLAERIVQPHPTLWLSAPTLPDLPSDLISLRDYLQPIPLALTLSSYEAAQLQAELQSSLPAILNWAIEGFQRWYTEAPIEPEVIQHATASFREDQDPIALFLAQSCTTAEPEATIPAHTLYQAYCSWARASGERPASASRFGARALASGLERTRHASGRFYHGLTFLPSLLFSPQSEEDPYPVAV